MIFIYKITNQVNKKVYIGMTSKPLQERLLGHFRNSKKPKFRLHEAINKHGKENFIIEQIAIAETQEDANKLEQYWIDQLGSTQYNVGYNMATGGSGKSIVLSEEVKHKIKKSVKAHRDTLTIQQKKELTRSANIAKTGMTESEKSRQLKSDAQSKRWETSTTEERKQHGNVSRNAVSEEGKQKSLEALKSSYSPARQPGFKHKQVTCPHCGKTGGANTMKRYHFDNCKEK